VGDVLLDPWNLIEVNITGLDELELLLLFVERSPSQEHQREGMNDRNAQDILTEGHRLLEGLEGLTGQSKDERDL
jgi:hypothetical protein